MPSSSLRESSSRSPRPAEEEPRRKRYSLLVEILDDDGFAVFERNRDVDRPRRSSRGTSTTRRRPNGGSEHYSDTNRQSRRVSVPSNVGGVGTRDHHDRPSERSRHLGTRSRTSRVSEPNDEVYDTAPEGNPPSSPGQQMQEDTEPPPSSHHQRRRRSIHSGTQTSIGGYGPRSAFTSPHNLYRPPHPNQGDLDVMEIAYRDGFHLGQHLANLRDPNTYRGTPPRPISVSSTRNHDRNQPDANRRPREHPEQQQQRGWRCLFPPWQFLNMWAPTESVVSSSSSQNQRRRR
ncbi:hypothetical protein F4813DRAFT_397608 [Daldinia decipiens]|uniref:uncharacterized protein n=1 Tax=Daldinia decipiens TaxID=326647 RepID=UPI0020C4D189|nr:uncharacterized protein F4813DRAFT_397608 [Daldinia decipiens]KAI1656447.1 hypothetical protein F4813DRAFT_397608 [Daldinia decipiens]